jgi:hypothetical protein
MDKNEKLNTFYFKHVTTSKLYIVQTFMPCPNVIVPKLLYFNRNTLNDAEQITLAKPCWKHDKL